MNTLSKPEKSGIQLPTSNGVFIFLSGNNFWEGLFDTVNVRFIRNLFEFKLTDSSHLLMTIIIPPHLSEDRRTLLSEKEDLLKKMLVDYGVAIEFYHIQGRTIKGLLSASKAICKKTLSYEKRFVWAHNYFNCLIGLLVRRQLHDTHVHFELLGLVPEEELYYSESNILSRLVKFLVLKTIGRIDLKKADSISVMSKRFKDYVAAKHRLNPSHIEVTPCLFDSKMFYQSQALRDECRQKHQIRKNEKLILYSGMFQKWQDPDLLFSFIKKMQMQDTKHEFRFMILTVGRETARNYVQEYKIEDLIIDTASGEDLNGVYNAADIGIASRSADLVSKVSSPGKIPEYLATQNGIILLESIGDYGIDLKHKPYALVKKDRTDLLNTTIEEICFLGKPDDDDLKEILEKYSIQENTRVIKRIIERGNER